MVNKFVIFYTRTQNDTNMKWDRSGLNSLCCVS